MLKIKINDFNLDDTVTCGQIFRYEKESDGSYTIILKDRVINVKLIKDELIITSNNEENLESVVKTYFDLDRNYDLINEIILSYDKNLKDVVSYCHGLKMIKQDPFETVISYVISQNNSVNAIRNSLNLISEKYGKSVEFNNKKYYLFPDIKELVNLTEADFRNMKVGFRDKYLVSVLKNIDGNILNLDEINNMETKVALDIFMSNKGIGPKVASCILLFAYQKFDVFPVDTWVKKYMKDSFDIVGEQNIIKYAKKIYKDYSGIVIQYMFHAKRNKNI